MQKILFQIFFLSLFLYSTHCYSKEHVIEEAALKLINQDRTEKSLSPLMTHPHFKKTNVAGRHTKDIYELNFPEQKELYIIKTFNNSLTFGEESRNYKNLNKFVIEFNMQASLNPSLPTFAQYIGSTSTNDIHLIVFKRALGESLLDYLARFAITDVQVPDTKEIGFKRLKMVGTAIALFHIMHKEQHPNEFYTKILADLSSSNIFLNFYDGHVTFIDYETLKEGDVNDDIDKLFDNGGTSVAEKAVQLLRPRLLASTSEFEALFNKIKHMYQEILNGYNAALLEAGLPYNLQCTFKDRVRTCRVEKKS